MSHLYPRRGIAPLLLTLLLIAIASVGGGWGQAYGQTGGPTPTQEPVGGTPPGAEGSPDNTNATDAGSVPGGNPSGGASLVPQLPTTAQTATISANGGTMQLAPGFAITFPAGAVAGDVTITFAPLAAPENALPNGVRPLLSFTFEAVDANGNLVTQFGQPFQLMLNYDPQALRDAGLPEDSLTLAYYNTTRNEWVIIPTIVDPQTHTVTVVADHFTEFALAAGNTQVLASEAAAGAQGRGDLLLAKTGGEPAAPVYLLLAALALLGAGGWTFARARKRA